ncbi:protease inhibitor I42 family protein [Pseudomonas protegens]|uniref:Protease inhibitor I42 family protein n=1 Tax=Pseudomonas protegens TaxID=380021 RepID=A0A7G8YJR8_9PSED|nr:MULTISPECIES: protease inhibitor I42 family protein [Pseudomonas]RBJ79877.1 peptidase inhibitor I42 [Pseudomonas sp. MWU12-2534b]MCO7572050.1 protease inhibitor I42 family protein [Pseudomonas chlororaphis]MCO7590100.1 protease inhibitor I42 family protein [Pseudomonas chlororaphis]MDF2399873.1 peptidase inhibitor I42 [Pseudomonas sp. 3MA1]QNH75918.1 protease inhibitor I42 family protein [Pseudomonas protegens]
MPAHRLLALFSLALLSACASQPKQNVSVDNQNQCPLHLHNGQTLTLTLPSNPTTGYRWAIQDSAGGILRKVSPEVYSNPEDTGLVGSGGQSTWRFQAFATGQGRLLLTYQQPWAPEEAPVKAFDCSITVN